jgi:hypothetical protein
MDRAARAAWTGALMSGLVGAAHSQTAVRSWRAAGGNDHTVGPRGGAWRCSLRAGSARLRCGILTFLPGWTADCSAYLVPRAAHAVVDAKIVVATTDVVAARK